MYRTTLILLALGILSACAQTPRAPAIVLLDSDHQAIAKTTQQTLEDQKVGEALAWENSITGRHGTVEALRTYENRLGRPCREYRQVLTVETPTAREVTALDAACRRSDGVWISLHHPSLSGALSYVAGGGQNLARHHNRAIILVPSFHYGVGFGYHHHHYRYRHRYRYRPRIGIRVGFGHFHL